MKKLPVMLAVLSLFLAGCGLLGGWVHYTGTGFTVDLPTTPTAKTSTVSVPNVGTPTVSSYALAVENPKCTVTITSFDSWPMAFDIPGVAYTLLLPTFLGNQGNRPATALVAKNGFSAQEYATNDGKSVLRLYLNKPAVRAIQITSQTNTLDAKFVSKVMDSFSPTLLTAK
jgi:hypothetical protein